MNRPAVQPDRFDLSRPENIAKLDATERLAALAADAGCRSRPSRSRSRSAHPSRDVRDPRPPHPRPAREPARRAALTLDDETLDRIDEIVPPGTNLTVDGTWRSPALSDPALRRRAVADRVAA